MVGVGSPPKPKVQQVICPLSYEIRKPLEQFCAFGYEVASHSASYYFATDSTSPSVLDV
jgi:hypothetical protein